VLCCGFPDVEGCAEQRSRVARGAPGGVSEGTRRERETVCDVGLDGKPQTWLWLSLVLAFFS